MMGYMNNVAKTEESIDSEGFLHSGDVGRLDEDGMLFITGRIKELLISAGGENIPPVPHEQNLKKECPAISNAMMVGDKRKFMSVLITLRTEPNADGTFTDILTGNAAKVSADSKTVAEAQKDPKWKAYIENGIKAANLKAVSRAARFSKYQILDGDFSVPGGELGPTLKLRRKVATANNMALIESLYA